MSVIKVKIQKEFTVLYNGVLEDSRLSFKAKGLWAYCMSKPDSWQFHVSHLATVCKDKEKAIYSALDELIAIGLVVRHQPNKPKGQRNGREGFCPVEYIIYPYQPEIQKKFAQHPFGEAQIASPQKEALVSTEKKQRTDKHKNPPPPSSKKKDPWEELRKNFEEEEFEFIQKRYRERPEGSGDIKNLKSWAKKVLENRDDSENFLEKQAKKHKDQATRWDKGNKKHRGDTVNAYKDYVLFSDGPHQKTVNYAISDEEWERQTGWKENEY